jgi:hypothetical protein
MAVRLSALAMAVVYPQEDSCYPFLLKAESIVRLEGLAQLKNPITSFGI